MPIQVELVATDRKVWSGEASLVVATTVDGELGIMGGHEPLMGVLADGLVRIRPADGSPEVLAAVHGGFLAVDSNVLSILAETAELSSEIDVARAERAIERARAAGADDPEEIAAIRRAESRLRAAVHPGRLH